MKKIISMASGLTLFLGSSFVSGSSNSKNLIVALGPWDSSAPEIVGALSDQKWLNSQNAAKLVSGDNLKFFSHTALTGQFKAGKPESLGVPCEETFSLPLSPNHKSKAFEIGVSANWNPRPRAITVLPNKSVPYLKIAKDFLEKNGLKNPNVILTSVLRTDIDNDKIDEVFLVGRQFQNSSSPDYFPPADGKLGDYSFALMRKMMAGKVQTIDLGSDFLLEDSVIDSDHYHMPQLFDLAGILDLNGDGKLELVTYGAYYEGYNFEILEWNGKKFISRGISGCGA